MMSTAVLFSYLPTTPLLAQESERTFFSVINDGGAIGYIIIALSLIASALVVEHFFSIRKSRFMPGELVSELDELLTANHIEEAVNRCDASDATLAKIIHAGLQHKGSMFGFYDMQNAMQEASEKEISKLYRKLEYLSFIAASAPMLGLLGTVTGMIGAFAHIDGGQAETGALAGDISQALVTTAMGLIVSIPAMFFVSLFKNRIDSLVAEAENAVEKLMGRFRNAQ